MGIAASVCSHLLSKRTYVLYHQGKQAICNIYTYCIVEISSTQKRPCHFHENMCTGFWPLHASRASRDGDKCPYFYSLRSIYTTIVCHKIVPARVRLPQFTHVTGRLMYTSSRSITLYVFIQEDIRQKPICEVMK